MGLLGGVVMLILGIGLAVLSRPRSYEEIRPFMRSAAAQVFVPTLCLALMAFGVAVIIVSL